MENNATRNRVSPSECVIVKIVLALILVRMKSFLVYCGVYVSFWEASGRGPAAVDGSRVPVSLRPMAMSCTNRDGATYGARASELWPAASGAFSTPRDFRSI